MVVQVNQGDEYAVKIHDKGNPLAKRSTISTHTKHHQVVRTGSKTRLGPR
jgi:hypothetical protein